MKRFNGFRKSVILLLCIAAGLLIPLAARAGEPTEQIKKTIDEVISILNEQELKKPEKREQRSARIRGVINARFDFEEMAKRSLALHWKKRTAEEQKEFVRLFSDLLEDTYIRKIERYEEEKVLYAEEKTDGNYSTVKTRIITSREVEIPVDYRIFRKGEKWEIYDIIIEGVSLVNNYRTQFSQIIRSASYEELVAKMRKKTLKE